MDPLYNIFSHFQRMGNLEGKATDYPFMLAIYLGIFFLCLIDVLWKKFKSYAMVEGGRTFIGDRERRWLK